MSKQVMTAERLEELRKIAEAFDGPGWTDALVCRDYNDAFGVKSILALLDLIDRQREALAGMLDNFGGYCCPEVDTAITVMQEAGIDRWSMQSQIESTFEIPK